MPKWQLQVDLIKIYAKVYCICYHVVYLWTCKCSWLTDAVLVSPTESCLLTVLSAESIRREWNYILGLAPDGNCCNILNLKKDGSVTEQHDHSKIY